MTIALTLLAAAFAACWVIPHVLRPADLRRHDPVLLIVTWLMSIAGVILTAAAGVVLLLLPSHGPSASILAAIRHCASVVQHGSPPHVEEAAGLLGIALLVALAARLALVSVRGIRSRARRRAENLTVLRLAARPTTDPSGILWLPHERPLAFSMAGRPGVVVATEGLAQRLDPAAVAAVLAHEHAHLTGRHHVLIAVAEAVRTTLPFVPLFRHAPRAIRDLVELAADITAARDCGRAAVRTALLGVAQHGAPGASLAMAQDAVDLRLARLRRRTRLPGKVRRAVSCGLAAAAASTLPIVAGTGFLVGLALITCQ